MKYVLGNWKMHGAPSDLWTWQEKFNPPTGKGGIEIALFLPHTLLNTQPMTFKVGAQDISIFEGQGAYTGEISASMVKGMGINYALCGHSERRHLMGEDNKAVQTKATNAINADITPVICVGEPLNVRQAGQENTYIENQLKESLPDKAHDLIIIAYEPVWAIGTGEVATLDQIASMHAHIFDLMKGLATHQNMAIVYGGSVKAGNARDIMTIDHVDGVLVGGASLDPQDFQRICEAAI